uniref:Uncharacterized protein n=1 Tax=Meloidogyne enterolobii TaxID=390850 RepID=A0A6V7U5R3_MELEN|nr:unnamed protein product [Meloidogyne enterolobii]
MKIFSNNKYPLNKIEINFYFFIWILHSLIAFVISIFVSSNPKKIGNWLNHWLEPSNYISNYFIDNSDVEWKLYKIAFNLILTTYALNSSN